MTKANSKKPIRIEKIMISPKRIFYVKLWPPSPNAKWGMTRATIELQEAKFSDDKQPIYGTPIRLPCDGSTALIADLISNYIIDGRRMNTEFKTHERDSSNITGRSSNSEGRNHSPERDLEALLLSEFSNVKLSKSRILSVLSNKGFNIEREILMQSLESLANQERITKESAVHTASGTNYFLWGFP